MTWLKITNSASSPSDKLAGLRWGILGSSSSDSGNTSTTLWHEHVASRTGIVNLEYADFGSYLTGEISGTSQLARLNDMPTDLNIITAMCGSNDTINGVALGTFADRTSNTFYGAYHLLCQGLLNKYPDKPIGLITPYYRAPYGTAHGATQEAIFNAMYEVAEFYAIPLLDLYKEGRLSYNFVPNNNASGLVDGDNLHASTAGHLLLSRPVESFLRRLVGG